MINNKWIYFLLLALLFLSVTSASYAAAQTTVSKEAILAPKTTAVHQSLDSQVILQAGGFTAIQGQSQDIAIRGLIGDYFAVGHRYDSNGLIGLGYYIRGKETSSFRLYYGLDAFYLAKTQVKGTVTQEQLFTNLAYRYSTINSPIYFAIKAIMRDQDYAHNNLTFDVGIGPNIVRTSNVEETSLDGGITIPDKTYSGTTTTVFSATAGIGVRMEHALGHIPAECGYRFFYLGKGRVNKLTQQLMTNFETGQGYANAVVCSVIF